MIALLFMKIKTKLSHQSNIVIRGENDNLIKVAVIRQRRGELKLCFVANKSQDTHCYNHVTNFLLFMAHFSTVRMQNCDILAVFCVQY